MRIGQGIDVHPLVPGRPLVIGGVTIPHPLGLEGDSDGDVLTHACMDALLGAARLGDLGTWFGPETPSVRGACSVDLLEQVGLLIKQAGFRVVNIDSTVLAQAPRLRPYAAEMESRLAGALKLPSDRVSVKATTTDHLGSLGRQEGIAALAVTLLESLNGKDS